MLSPFELVQYNMETEEPVRDNWGLCIPARPGMGAGGPSLGVGRAETLGLLRGWNKPPKALRLMSSGGVCSPHLDPESQACLTAVRGPLPLSLSALPSSSASTSCPFELFS